MRSSSVSAFELDSAITRIAGSVPLALISIQPFLKCCSQSAFETVLLLIKKKLSNPTTITPTMIPPTRGKGKGLAGGGGGIGAGGVGGGGAALTVKEPPSPLTSTE